MQCVASAEYGGVPHGLDGDVVMALTDLYIEQGAPEDGKIRTSAYALLGRAGLGDGGHYYAVLRRSLHRRRFAGYSASECWREAERERWITVTFTYLAGLNLAPRAGSCGSGAAVNWRLHWPSRLCEVSVRRTSNRWTMIFCGRCPSH
ncbi:hypothetical protein FNU79_15080 [Deinococcus detaillensis]|uniref:Uncharacterized protein n=1 Tax=Deinococcus detaillensis TaxID=2592048 RepID=A0A553UNC0_9DEIO|nr:hypothetical protein FNU79_15080 [Deinococcus detaillensis]